MSSPKRLLTSGLLAAAILTLAACGSSATAAPGSSAAPGAGSSSAGSSSAPGLGGLGGLLPSGLIGGSGTASVNASTILTAAVAASILGGTPTLQPGSMNLGPISLATYGTDSGDDVTVYVETLGTALEAQAIQAAIQAEGTSGDMTPISGLGDAAGKVVDAHQATVAFGKNGTIVVVEASVASQAGTDLEPKVEAIAQQVASQL
jgi:hypothetical protein